MLVAGQDARVTTWVIAQNHSDLIPAGAIGIGWERAGKLSAGLVFHSHSAGRNLFADIAITDRRFPFALLRLGLRYPFEQLKLPRLTFSIDSANLRSKALVSRLGAVREATLSCAAREGDLDFWVLRPESDFCRRFLYGKALRAPAAGLRQAHPRARSVEPSSV